MNRENDTREAITRIKQRMTRSRRNEIIIKHEGGKRVGLMEI